MTENNLIQYGNSVTWINLYPDHLQKGSHFLLVPTFFLHPAESKSGLCLWFQIQDIDYNLDKKKSLRPCPIYY